MTAPDFCCWCWPRPVAFAVMAIWDGLDPLHSMQQLLVVGIGALVLIFAWIYRGRILHLLTGDDRIHLTCGDAVWYGCCLCRCCPCCFFFPWCSDGEWTRLLTNCPCCPHWLYRKNICKTVGRCLGFVSHTVEIRNITVGDLPFDQRGDFYLSIECTKNPPMVTALQEEKLPKIVHFPEILCLKVKESFLEPYVRIVVRECNVLGSNDLCDIHLAPVSIVEWSKQDPPKNMMRFQMRVLDKGIERITPPWCLVEFSEAEDVRGIEADAQLATRHEVRTWVPVSDHTVLESGHPPIAQPGGVHGRGANSWRNGETRQNVDLKITDFKGAYSLLDDAGNPIQEPEESNLAKYRCKRICFNCIFGFSQCLVFTLALVWGLFRWYVFSCYRHFRWVTIAKDTTGVAFPISIADLRSLVKECHEDFDGTGIQNTRCRPTSSEIQAVCQADGLPPGQPRPEGFTILAEQLFGIDRGTKFWTPFGEQEWNGVGCFKEGDHWPAHAPSWFPGWDWPVGICQFRNMIVPHGIPVDLYIVLGFLLLCCCTYALRCCLDANIRRDKRNDQNKANNAVLAAKRNHKEFEHKRSFFG